MENRHFAYHFLGVLIERLTGKLYASYVAESILGPSGMANTSFHHANLSPRTPLASPIIPTQREAALLAVLNENLPDRDGESIISARSGDFGYLTDLDILAPWGGLVGPADDVARFL